MRMPKNVAQFLKLPNAEKYTGHAFRGTSAIRLAELGADTVAIQRHGGWKPAQLVERYVEESDALKNSTTQQISKNINLSTIEKMINPAVDAEQKNDDNPDFQKSKAEEKKSEAEEKKSETEHKLHYHFHNCNIYFK